MEKVYNYSLESLQMQGERLSGLHGMDDQDFAFHDLS